MEIAKLKSVVIALILVVAIIIPIYSAYVTQEIPVGINVVSAVVKVYWDYECTQPVTHIDYGEVTQGLQIIMTNLYIKNEGTGTVWVYWTSTLSQTTDKITDSWWDGTAEKPLNGSGFVDYPPYNVHSTRYEIHLSEDLPLGLYNWTLTIGVLEYIP